MKLTLSQKDGQLQLLQKEHLELMRQLTTTQENLHTKEQAINQLEARYLELEAQLAELQTETNAKEDNIQYLQNEKIVLEVALQAARVDKSQLDENAERLGEDVLVASDVLDQLRQEVQVKANQVRDMLEHRKYNCSIMDKIKWPSHCNFFSFFLDWNSPTRKQFPEETMSKSEGAVPAAEGSRLPFCSLYQLCDKYKGLS